MWSVPTGAWKGEACFILGGGPSLPVEMVPEFIKRGRVIAINTAYKLHPEADICYFADLNFFEWNRRDLHNYTGPLLLTRNDLPHIRCKRKIRRIAHMGGYRLSRDPGHLAGWCSGSNALNLAYLHGADPIVLLGFDMKPVGNWHSEHKKTTRPDRYEKKYIPFFEAMAPELAKDGIRVLNASPGSALSCFPIIDPEEILNWQRNSAYSTTLC